MPTCGGKTVPRSIGWCAAASALIWPQNLPPWAAQQLPFTKSEYAICEFLALHAGQTFGKEQIYEAVFGYDGTADDTAITQHIKNIRAKLRTAGLASPETVLKTVWGVGYLWNAADA